eukprot:6017694-Prymnesium_polylepis.1
MRRALLLGVVALLPLIASFEDENDAVEEIMDSPIVNGKIDSSRPCEARSVQHRGGRPDGATETRWTRRSHMYYRYRKAFEDYARALHKDYPDLTFNGGTFHPGDLRAGLAHVLQLCFFAGIVLAMGGKRLLPEPLQKLIDDNSMAGMMLIFFCNMASGACLNTGAFEVRAHRTTPRRL